MWLFWVFVAACGVFILLCGSFAVAPGLSSCRVWTQSAWAQWMWLVSIVAPQYVGS